MTTLNNRYRYLLLQMRRPGDAMKSQEVDCFLDVLQCDPRQVETFDLTITRPSRHRLAQFDVILLGGSGDFSVAQGGPWLDHALETLCDVVESARPTFASCWGFQAMARALGGEVVTDLTRAELGAVSLQLSPQGQQDPVFRSMPPTFVAAAGHQDIVVRLPPGTVHLASSKLVENQAFRFANKPIYCTQFHPELNRRRLLQRLEAYPSYIEIITNMTLDEFERQLVDTASAAALLQNFVDGLSRGDW